MILIKRNSSKPFRVGLSKKTRGTCVDCPLNPPLY